MPRRSLAPFATLEGGVVLSGVGNGMSYVAFPWIVLELTGSASTASLVAAAAAVPLVFSPLFSGTLVDIVGRRRVAVVSDVLSAASVGTVPVLALLDMVSVPWLVLLAALGAVFDPAGVTARETMLPGVARRGHLTLERVNGVHEALFGVAYLVGPAAVGLLIATVGGPGSMAFAAGAFLLAALLTRLVPDESAALSEADGAGGGFWRRTVEGVVFVWRDRTLRTLALLTLVLWGTWVPVEGVILPVHFQELDSPGSLGLVLAAMSAGAILGGLGYGVVGHRLRGRRVLLAALAGASLAILGMATLPTPLAMAVLGFVAGACFGPFDPILNTAMQRRSPEHFRGRVVGALSSIALAAGPVGLVLIGPLIGAVGLETAFLLLATTLMVIAAVAILLPGLRGLDVVEGATREP